MPVIMRKAEYPDDILGKLSDKINNVVSIDALSYAKEAGTIKAVNVVMLGKLAKELGFDKEIFVTSIKKTVPQKFIDLNLIAFEKGYK